MSTSYPSWVDGATNGSWNSTTNWSTGAVPDADDVFTIDYSSRAITTGMDQSAVTFSAGSQMVIGPNFSGSIGTAASPLVLSGGTLDKVLINAPLASSINIRVGTATNFIVMDASARENAVYLTQGTATTLQVIKAGNFRLGASATGTTCYFGRQQGENTQVTLESGATVTTATQYGGYVYCEAAATTINVRGGRWIHAGTSTGAATTLTIGQGGYFSWEGYNSGTPYTIGTINVEPGGVLDGSKNLFRNIATTINLFPGGRCWLSNAFAVGTLNDRGGDYRGPAPTTHNGLVPGWAVA